MNLASACECLVCFLRWHATDNVVEEPEFVLIAVLTSYYEVVIVILFVTKHQTKPLVGHEANGFGYVR